MIDATKVGISIPIALDDFEFAHSLNHAPTFFFCHEAKRGYFVAVTSRRGAQTSMNDSRLSSTVFLALAMSGADGTVRAQCSGYSVEIFTGPDCPILSSFASAHGISDTGAICGGYVDCAEVGHHVIWSAIGEVIEMPPSADGGFPDTPREINSNGQVAGRMYVPSVNPPERAFLYSDGIALNLGTLPGGNKSETNAINEGGTVCGYSTGIGQPLAAFLWQDGIMSALQLPFGTHSVANDISDSNGVCGWMGNASWLAHAYVWFEGKVIDLSTVLPDANGANATGINNLGNVCGYAIYGDPSKPIMRRGFLWATGEVVDLGILPGLTTTTPVGLNDAKVIVGYCNNFPIDGLTRGFVWRNGKMQGLNDLIQPELNLDIKVAWDINNAGQIVGEATVLGSGGDRVAVRLTPIPSPTGDSDCDNDVDVDDLLTVINHWADASPKGSNALPPGDFDHDGVVELDDLAIVLDNWTF